MKKYTEHMLKQFFERWPSMEYLENNIKIAVEETTVRIKQGGKILVCGNGGSASDSEHIVGELLKEFYIQRAIDKDFKNCLINRFGEEGKYISNHLQGTIPALSLVSQVGFLTAFSNDASFDFAYAQQIYAYATNNDVLIAISTSGEAENVNYGAIVARAKGALVISLTGKAGGKLKDRSDILLNVPAEETYIVQEYHLPIYHLFCQLVEYEMFGEGP